VPAARERRRRGQRDDEEAAGRDQVRDAEAPVEYVDRQARDCDRPVADADVARVDDAPLDGVHVQGEPQPARDDQRRADVADHERERGSRRADAALDREQEQREQGSRDQKLRRAAQPEGTRDQHTNRVVRELVEVRAAREQELVRLLRRKACEHNRRRDEHREVGARERREAGEPAAVGLTHA
jgi:hypothetical protein